MSALPIDMLTSLSSYIKSNWLEFVGVFPCLGMGKQAGTRSLCEWLSRGPQCQVGSGNISNTQCVLCSEKKRKKKQPKENSNTKLWWAVAGGNKSPIVECWDMEEPFYSREMVLLAKVMIHCIFLTYQSSIAHSTSHCPLRMGRWQTELQISVWQW